VPLRRLALAFSRRFTEGVTGGRPAKGVVGEVGPENGARFRAEGGGDCVRRFLGRRVKAGVGRNERTIPLSINAAKAED